MKIAFLCNFSARRKEQFPHILSRIEREIADEKEIFVVNRDQSDSMEKHLSKIVRGGAKEFDRIVVVGGDGSLNRVISYLYKENCLDQYTLGVIPMGTGNDFSRSLGYRPGQTGRAIRAIQKNHAQKVSVAKVNDHCFINNAGFGKKNPTEKRTSPLRVIQEMGATKLAARWDDEKLEGEFFMMLCANAPYFSGGLFFSASSDSSDDRLEFFFVKKANKFRLALKLLLGRAHWPLCGYPFSEDIVTVRSSNLTIQTENQVSIVTDGEPVKTLADTRAASFSIAGRVNFLAPE